MNIVRIRELTDKQVEALGTFLRGKIVPEDAEVGTEWVCRGLQQAHWWSTKYLLEVAAGEKGKAVDAWIALDGAPIGICWVNRGRPDRFINMFMVDEALSPADQLIVADALALRSIDEMLADGFGTGDFVSVFPNDTPAATYAKLCGFKAEVSTAPNVVAAVPKMTMWRVGMKELRDNILARQK